MLRTAAYLQPAEPDKGRDNYEWTPEFSRRARGFPVYAALRSLGRKGVEAMVDRCCDHARLFARLDYVRACQQTVRTLIAPVVAHGTYNLLALAYLRRRSHDDRPRSR